MKKSLSYLLSIYIATVLFCIETSMAIAKPPPWAPAHGYRNKNKDNYRYSNDDDRDRFGIGEGRCHRQSAGQYLGQERLIVHQCISTVSRVDCWPLSPASLSVKFWTENCTKAWKMSIIFVPAKLWS